MSSITECVGANEDKCQPAPGFKYTPGGDQSFIKHPTFAASPLSTTRMIDAANGNYGVVLGDFTGDGRTDILRWGNTPSDNQLWLSQGDGSFMQVPGGAAPGQFNLNTQKLFSSDGCYSSVVADFNADGISDVLRTVQTTNSGGGACPVDSNLLFIGIGGGSFKAPIGLTGINLSSVKEKFSSTATGCYQAFGPVRDGDLLALATVAATPTNTTCYDQHKTAGTAFHLIDFNGDGILDIVTTVSPGYSISYSSGDPIPTPDELCAATVCTHLYMGSSVTPGSFKEWTATSLSHHSVYLDPPTPGGYAAFVRPAVVDIDGDGLADLVVKTGAWRSSGDGNFKLVATNGPSCADPLDFNGDGRPDCVVPTTVPISATTGNQGLQVMTGDALTYISGFNLTGVGQDLWGLSPTNQQQSIGTLIGDFNGDGRGDILRWEDAPAKNVLFLSNGDGTFRTSASFNLTSPEQVLRSSDDKTAYLAGDFTGHGTIEILRMKDNPTAGSEGTTNQLYVRVDPSPPDLLQTVTSSTGLKTTLTYVPLTNSSSGAIGKRYSAGAPIAFPRVNVAAPIYVVATVTTESGVSGTGNVNTEYTYQGLRAHLQGRGLLGFARTSQQSLGANGQPLTVTTDYLQDHPYIGVASVSQTFNGAIGSQVLLSRTTNNTVRIKHIAIFQGGFSLMPVTYEQEPRVACRRRPKCLNRTVLGPPMPIAIRLPRRQQAASTLAV